MSRKTRPDYLCLYTKNCIVTKKPATIWTGHVVAENHPSPDGGEIHIIAGFVDKETLNNYIAKNGPCFGPWKAWMGLEHNELL